MNHTNVSGMESVPAIRMSACMVLKADAKSRKRKRACLNLCVCMYMLLCVFVCVSVCVSTYILVCRYMCVCLYISVYICLRCLHLCIRCLYISVSYALGAEAEQLLGVSVFVCFTGVKCQPHLAIIT